MKRISFLVIFSFLLAACGSDIVDLYTKEAPTTTGDNGPYVETSNLLLRAYATNYSEVSSGYVQVNLNNNETDDSLRIGSGDSLSVEINGSPLLVVEKEGRSCTGKALPAGSCIFTYSYVANFQEYPEGQEMIVSLSRESGISSQTTVTFPARPTVIEPVPGVEYSLSADTLDISWVAGQSGDSTELGLYGECAVYDGYWYLGTDNLHSIAPGTYEFFKDSEFCNTATEFPLEITTYRYREYDAAPELAASSIVRLDYEENPVTIYMVP